jgi:aryl-alcohol dehydrogenase-like predicted oxidoreductase
MKRTLGKSGIEVSASGLGCWAIGGPFKFETIEAGWGEVDDHESIHAVQAAIDLGVTFFDTAANYGAGHSEKILGQGVAGHREKVVLATKFGYGVFEEEKLIRGVDSGPQAIRQSCEASLRRLGTDYIDLFQFHVGDYPIEQADEVMEVLETLIKEGKIRSYGWSTDSVERAKAFAHKEHFSSVQHQLNIFEDNPDMLALCEAENLASINRGPLAMGLLTGKYATGANFETTDVRANNLEWMNYFKNGQPNPEWLEKLESVKEILSSNGRTLTQGALAWLWGRSPKTIPIPGFRTVKQVEENAKALEFGPLTGDQMKEIETILNR